MYDDGQSPVGEVLVAVRDVYWVLAEKKSDALTFDVDHSDSVFCNVPEQ